MKTTAEHLGKHNIGWTLTMSAGENYIEGMLLGIKVGPDLNNIEINVNVGGWFYTLEPTHKITVTEPWR